MKGNLPLALMAAFVILLLGIGFLLTRSSDQSDLIPVGPKRSPAQVTGNIWQGNLFSLELKDSWTSPSVIYTGSEESLSFTEENQEVFLRAFPLNPGESLESVFPPSLRQKIKKSKLGGLEGFLIKGNKSTTFSFVRDNLFFEIDVVGARSQDLASEIVPRLQAVS